MTLIDQGAALRTLPDVLPELVDGLVRLGAQLDEFGAAREHWTHVVRTLHHAQQLNDLRLIAVAGGQGAGKTTLVRALYPQAADWLRPNLGRGEKIPVCVVETLHRPQPRAVAIRRQGRELKVKEFQPGEISAWQNVLSGSDPDVLMARIEVEPTLWNSIGSGFVLLPGFERMDGYWQTLMRVVLNTSAAAVVVTDESRLADGMQERIVADLRDTGDDQPPADVVVAVSRADGEDDESLGELVAQASAVFGVPVQRVVPFGPGGDDPPGWRTRFIETVGAILPSADHARRREAALLRAVIRDDVGALLGKARESFDNRLLTGDNEVRQLEAFLQPYDQERDWLLDRLDNALTAAFGPQGLLGAAASDLAQRIGDDGLGEAGRRLLDRLRFDPQGKDHRLIGLVRKSWNPERAREVQRQVLAQVAEGRLAELATARAAGDGDGDGDGETYAAVVMGARKALGLPAERPGKPAPRRKAEPGEPVLLTAMAMLPAMAVATRGFALSFTDEHGQVKILPDGLPIEQHLEGMTKDRKAFLAGTALFLGLDIAADGDLDSPQVIANAVTTLLTGKGAGAGAGAAAAAPYVALGVVVVASGMALVAAANRAAAERADLGQRLLQRHRDVAVANAREGVTGLLRVTREILAARMAADLGIGEQQRRRYALLQTINDVDNARYRLLRQHAGRDVA